MKKINYIILALSLILIIGLYLNFKQSPLPKQNNTSEITQNTIPADNHFYAPVTSTENTLNTPRIVAKNTKVISSSLSMTTTTKTTASVPAHLKWGAYVGDTKNSLTDFETLVGKQVNILADFEGWDNEFPSHFKSGVGQAGKTLMIFWEPAFGYDTINSGSQDNYIKKFAADAEAYKYPVIIVPFAEMNLNEEAWGFGQNGNTADKFKTAWIHIHNLFADVKNVKFGLAYNNVSIPEVADNRYSDYYPGSAYVDYVGVDGFDFGDPHLTFGQIFDSPIKQLSQFKKPIYIFSMAAIAGPEKAAWITDGLGKKINTYSNVAGWIWFNESKLEEGRPIDWRVNSDNNSLQAFKSVLP